MIERRAMIGREAEREKDEELTTKEREKNGGSNSTRLHLETREVGYVECENKL
jgi:hypothetical protein